MKDSADFINIMKTCGNAAMKACFLKFRYLVFSTAYQSTGNIHTSDDVVQNVFSKIVEDFDKFRHKLASEGDCERYLRLMAKSATYDHRERKNLVHGEIVGDIEERRQGPAEAVTASEFERRVRELIEELPKAQRDVLKLMAYAGMKYGDVATCLNIPIKTAHARHHRARVSLRAALLRESLETRPP